MLNLKTLFTVLISVFLGISPVFAQSKEALAKAQYMVRQLNAEKVSLQKENTNLKKQLTDLQATSDKELKATKKGSNKAISKLKNRNQQLSEALQQARAELSQLKMEQRQMSSAVQAYDESLNSCVANNKKLYEVNLELTGEYEEKGVWAAITQAEPFTRLKQVEIENLVQDYQRRMQEYRVTDIGFKEEVDISPAN